MRIDTGFIEAMSAAALGSLIISFIAFATWIVKSIMRISQTLLLLEYRVSKTEEPAESEALSPVNGKPKPQE